MHCCYISAGSFFQEAAKGEMLQHIKAGLRISRPVNPVTMKKVKLRSGNEDRKTIL